MAKYAGNEWIERNFKVEMSPLGRKVADLLGDLFLGIYHLDNGALKRVDWSDNHHIQFILSYHELATTDWNELTKLVILCHDRLVRCSIQGCGPNRLRLLFYQRANRDGEYHERHPTIEQAIQDIRKHYELNQ